MSSKYKPREYNWDQEWRIWLVGGLAGSTAKTAVAPLDRVKILFQVRSPEFAKYNTSWWGPGRALWDIYRKDGVARGLFRGHSATLLRIFPYSALKFSLFDKIKFKVIPSKQYDTFARQVVSGSLTGLATIICTYPLDFIRTRLAVETKHNFKRPLITTIKRIYNEVPPAKVATAGKPAAVASTMSVVQNATPMLAILKISNYYRGFVASSIGMIPYAGASFSVENHGRKLMQDPRISPYTTKQDATISSTNKPPELKTWAQLIVGGAAGGVAQTISYPLEVVRRRIQIGGQVGDGRRLGIVETARTIFHEGGGNFNTPNGFIGGLRRFYVGIPLGYAKIVPMHGISFLIWRKGKPFMGLEERVI